MNEFTLINHYFKQRTQKRDDVLLGIGDDCALLSVPAQQTLVTSMDTLISGVHFPVPTLASDIGYKSLAVSLSDLAAMGAEPAWVMLALSMPEADKTWLEDFCQGFFALCDQYGLQLVGGDTTRGPLSMTTQVMGFIPKDQALLRSGARVGDKIFVTGCLGGAGLGLMVAQNTVILSAADLQAALKRLNRPEARVAAGRALRGIATSAIDISDGLLADLGHILQASGVGAVVHVQDLPVDPLLKNNVSPEKAYQLALSAGDDYELCFTVPEARCEQLKNVFAKVDCGYRCIGIIKAGAGIRVLDAQGNSVMVDGAGYRHF
jgi:thiamine-monophosphate kinase